MNPEQQIRRSSNTRTALVLVSVVLVFFFGIIVKNWLLK
jgi:hypothetical protein